MLLGAVKPAQFYRFFFFCLSGLCPEQHRAGFVLRDEISAQNDLLTPDQTPPHRQSQRLRVSSTMHGYIYLLRSVQ